jgi:hypothetical protein
VQEIDSRKIQCPYCGETIEVLIDCSISEQDYIEDCQVCCHPIGFYVSIDEDGNALVSVAHENE